MKGNGLLDELLNAIKESMERILGDRTLWTGSKGCLKGRDPCNGGITREVSPVSSRIKAYGNMKQKRSEAGWR